MPKSLSGQLQVTPFEYDQIMYNVAIEYQERDWGRKMSDHEKNVLIQGFRIGMTVKTLEQWTAEGYTSHE